MFRILLCLLLAAAAVLPLPASAQNALLNSEITVDVTAGNAADARQQAMNAAPMQGFSQLVDKLAPDRKQAILSTVDPKKVAEIVRGIEVLNEQILGNRYLASLRVSFDALTANAMLGTSSSGNVPEVAKFSTSFLVLPVYLDGDTELLWEKKNPWFAAWRQVGLEAGGGNIVVPYADAQDVSYLTARTAQSNPYDAFAGMLGRYGTTAIAVLKATYVATPEPKLSVLRRIISANQNDVQMFDYRADPQEDQSALMLRAARDMVSQLAQQRDVIIEQRAMEGGSMGRQLVVIPISTLGVWTQTRAKLLTMPVVTQVELHAISSGQADAFVHYKGTADGLDNALHAAGFRTQKMSNYWVLTPP